MQPLTFVASAAARGGADTTVSEMTAVVAWCGVPGRSYFSRGRRWQYSYLPGNIFNRVVVLTSSRDGECRGWCRLHGIGGNLHCVVPCGERSGCCGSVTSFGFTRFRFARSLCFRRLLCTSAGSPLVGLWVPTFQAGGIIEHFRRLTCIQNYDKSTK